MLIQKSEEPCLRYLFLVMGVHITPNLFHSFCKGLHRKYKVFPDLSLLDLSQCYLELLKTHLNLLHKAIFSGCFQIHLRRYGSLAQLVEFEHCLKRDMCGCKRAIQLNLVNKVRIGRSNGLQIGQKRNPTPIRNLGVGVERLAYFGFELLDNTLKEFHVGCQAKQDHIFVEGTKAQIITGSRLAPKSEQLCYQMIDLRLQLKQVSRLKVIDARAF